MLNFTTNKVFIWTLLFLIIGCESVKLTRGFNLEEKELIVNQNFGEKFRLLDFSSKKDSLFLRKIADSIDPKDNEYHQQLVYRMLATVHDKDNPGVGIAAPQIGVSKQIILVQRFDKEEKPFEVYYNPKIIEYSNTQQYSVEGCLSIPNDVFKPLDRKSWVIVSYQDKDGKFYKEKIEGFTAIIFQHEVDHLNGVLYIDRILNP